MEIASSLHQVEWAMAQRAIPGESVSGDRHVALPHRRGLTLAVIDGIGHGPEAAKAAELAAATLRRMPENNLLAHLNCCHLALTNTRGVVMTLAEYNLREHTLTLCGVGNVEATLFRCAAGPGIPPQESALLRGGIVGCQLPAPYASVFPVQPGDVLVMASDGIRMDFSRDLAWRSHLQHLADTLMEKNFKGNDDALVLFARLRDPGDE
jgi:negative regulator of sigma-B (phosphoserine phosphatase)